MLGKMSNEVYEKALVSNWMYFAYFMLKKESTGGVSRHYISKTMALGAMKILGLSPSKIYISPGKFHVPGFFR